MKNIVFICIILLCSCQQTNEFIGKVPEYAGKPLSVTESLSPINFNRLIQIEGTIYTVCKEEGCWLTLKQGNKKIKVLFTDPTLVVPTNSEGKTFRGEGMITEEVLKLEETEVYAKQLKIILDTNSGNKRVPIFTVSTIFTKGLLND